jgi:hypothetical protein
MSTPRGGNEQERGRKLILKSLEEPLGVTQNFIGI